MLLSVSQVHRSGDAAEEISHSPPQCLFFTIITFPLLDKYTLWQVIKVLEQDLTHLRDLNPFPSDCNIQRGQKYKPYFQIREQPFSAKEKERVLGDCDFPNERCGCGGWHLSGSSSVFCYDAWKKCDFFSHPLRRAGRFMLSDKQTCLAVGTSKRGTKGFSCTEI